MTANPTVLFLVLLGPSIAWAQSPQAPAADSPRAGEEHRVKAEDIDALLEDGKVFFLDVREPWELEKFGTLEGYVNIPIDQLEKRLAELPADRAILTA